MTDTARDQAIVQVQSIATMVAAYEVDYDRLKELRDLRGHVAGWNMPGYMPDSEPVSFDSADDAREYIAGAMRDFAEQAEPDAESEREAEELTEAAEECEQGSGEYGRTVAGYHYWVTQDGNMLDPDEAEELAGLEEAAGDCESQEDALDRIQEDPLPLEYRSGWASPGEELTPEEFRIVLCTGGPHVEIVGDVDLSRVRVLYRDWGDSGELFDFDRDAVVTYCQIIGIGE